jgi:hypothetical protein
MVTRKHDLTGKKKCHARDSLRDREHGGNFAGAKRIARGLPNTDSTLYLRSSPSS